jgi:TetR/AcrR family transcriptional repressor of nem operon
MRVSREQAAQTRDRIVEVASALFRAKGFGGVGVADIMKGADLTHGGFYGHFGSKDDLAVEASRRALAASAARWQRIVTETRDKPYPALIDHYLSVRHCGDAAMATMVGAVTLARAVDDPALSEEILDAARQELRTAAYR